MRLQFGEANWPISANGQPSLKGAARSRTVTEREARHVGLVPRQPRTTERTARTAGLTFEAWVAWPVWLKQMPLFWRPANKSLYFNH